MPYKTGYREVYYIGEDHLTETTGLATKTGKPVVYSEIIQNYNKSNQFVDIDFPTDDSSVDAKKLNFDAARGLSFPNWDYTVIWKRPQEALEIHNQTNYDLSPGKQVKYVFSQASVKDRSAKSRFDITQGRIGDCWMVASLSQVTQKQEIIDFVVPEDNLNNNDSGAYHFRYYHFGAYVDVVVDDYIPLFEERGPGTGYSIMICKPPLEDDVYEIWPLLAEKAYAKIQGTIQQINGSAPLFALEDLTGGIGENIGISNNFENPSKLFEKLMRLNRMSFIGLSTPHYEGKRQGLAGGHAYCVTALTTVTYRGQQIELIRLRNPWGEGEWEGAWNDKSPEFNELSEEDRKKVGLVVEEDGEFWISASDALQYFDSVGVCYWFPEALMPLISKTFDIQTYHGEFTVETSNQNEPWNNPQYVIEVKGQEGQDCAILANVTLKCKLQDTAGHPYVSCYRILDPSAWPGNKFPQEFFDYTNNSKQYEEPTTTDGTKQNVQQRTTAGFSVPPGKYVIVPTLLNNPANYPFVLRLSGQIVSQGEVNSMAKQVQLADDVHTETGVARKPTGAAADLANQFADSGIDLGLDASMFSGLSGSDANMISDLLKGYKSRQGSSDGPISLTPQFLFQ